MKKALAIILLLAALGCAAMGEGVYDGSSYAAYMLNYDESLLSGMETITYVEPEGLLLSAFSDNMELTVSIESTSGTPAELIEEVYDGVSRYGRVTSKGEIEAITLNGVEGGAYLYYTYQSLRGSATDDVFRCDMCAGKVSGEYTLVITMTSWAQPEEARELFRAFAASVTPAQKNISTEFKVLLKACEQKTDGIYVTVDYCEVEYEALMGTVYAINDDPTEYTYMLSDEADVWLPKLDGVLYSTYHIEPDAYEIAAVIEDYAYLNGTDGIYTIIFDQNGKILRLQHYNAV